MTEPIQLDGLSLEELEALRDQVHAALQQRQDAERAETLNEIKRLAERVRLTPEQLAAELTPRRRRSGAGTKGKKLPPKYRNAKKPDEVWSGRGKQPVWMREAIAAGAQKDDFLIEKA